MASKFLGTQTVKATRGFAAQAAAKPVTEFSLVPKEAAKTTTLANGVVVASVETNAPLSRVGIAFRAGSRNETAGKQGLVHNLRISAGLSNKQTTQFALARTLNQAGASLTCTAGREHIIYSIDATRQQIDGVLSQLGSAATQPAYKPWELADNVKQIKLDLAALQPATQVLELLHQVAFRSGLANTLFCPQHLIGKHSSETLHEFVNTNLVASNAAVVGVGVPHDRLVAYAQNLNFRKGQSTGISASKVFGGEIRQETGGSTAYVAVTAAGASLADTKSLITFALLERHLGAGSAIKYGYGAGSKLIQATGGSGIVSALNINYSDAGLFGFVVAVPASEAGKVVSSAAKALRSIKVNDSQLNRAKAQLKADLLMGQENTAQILEELTLQSLLKLELQDVVSAVDKITSADVNTVASQLASAKLAVGAVGNVSQVPHADEL